MFSHPCAQELPALAEGGQQVNLPSIALDRGPLEPDAPRQVDLIALPNEASGVEWVANQLKGQLPDVA